MYACKPDYEQAQKRMNAFWNHEETDRPLVLMTFPKFKGALFPKKEYPSHEAYWLDVEYRAEEVAHMMDNTFFYADSMPVHSPNLGPEIVSAWAGCPYHFGETTTWTDPCIFDWEKDSAVIDMNHPLAKKLEEYTRLLLERAKGKFIVGLTDFHPGGDHVAALRDPQTLAMDLLEYPEAVKEKLKSSYREYYVAFDFYVDWLKNEGMPIASWLPITSETSMYIPSNDFSCMISREMFDEFFLEGIIEECRHYKRSVYHLDGPDALRHLDSLLSIPELNAIQWVPGAGNDQCTTWLGLFKQILSAGKSIIVYPQNMDDLRFLMENLPAQGLCIQMWDVENEDNARDIMSLIDKWDWRKK